MILRVPLDLNFPHSVSNSHFPWENSLKMDTGWRGSLSNSMLFLSRCGTSAPPESWGKGEKSGFQYSRPSTPEVESPS